MADSFSRPLHIVGAGPAGLAAAITAAKSGASVIVHERAAQVGSRFHDDFEGLENWTTAGDVLDELAAIGIAADFDATPFRELILYLPGGERRILSQQPFFYLVRRGASEGTLDSALAARAEDAGVDIRYGDNVAELHQGGIVATGPHVADAIASGWLFETDLPDGAWAAIGEEVAPGGYAYLLSHAGKATLAVCLFSNFTQDETCVERAVSLFQARIGFQMRARRRFGGAGNMRIPDSAIRSGPLLYVGEAAGFQDPLWGFGIRTAIRSGTLAAHAWLDGRPKDYDVLWRRDLGGTMRSAVVNRFFYEVANDSIYRWLGGSLARARDPRRWLRRFYAPSRFKNLLYPMVKNSILRPFERPADCSGSHCRCTWCRCVRGVALPEKAGFTAL